MSINLLQLWMPILLSALLLWVASALIHMAIKYHNHDYKKLPNEDEVSAAVRKGSPAVGLYTFPYCIDMSEMSDPDMQRKFEEGPIGFLTIFESGMPRMGKQIGQQIIYFVIGCALIGYCASLALPAGAAYLSVFGVVSAIGFLSFGWAIIPFSIWYGHPWSNTARYMLDAVIYALLAAGTFAWLWPAAA